MNRTPAVLLILAAALLGATAGAYKPLCKDSAGRLIQCAGNLDNAQAPAAIAAGTITGTLGVSQGGTGATAVTAHGVMVANGSGTALQSTNAPTTPGQHLIWDGAQWLPGLQTGTVYYFRRDASDIGGGYEQITKTPQTGAEKTASTTLNNASGTVVFDRYATNVGEPGLTQLQAGTWEFDIYAQVSSTAGGNSTNVVIQVYQRTTGGTETLLFSTTSPALDSTSPKLYSWLYTQAADIALDITDRLVVKVAATNSSASNRTVTFYYEGTARYSHFHPPFLSLVDGGALVTIGGTQTITGAKQFTTAPTMSGANIASASIQNSALANPSATINTTSPIAGGGTLTLGNSLTLSLTTSALPNATNGTSVLSGTYNVTGPNGTWQSVGVALSLPSSGTYHISCEVRSLLLMAVAPGSLSYRLYNTTDAAAVSNSERLGLYAWSASTYYLGTASLTQIVTVAAAKTIDLQAMRDLGTTYTQAQIDSDASGRTQCAYIKLY